MRFDYKSITVTVHDSFGRELTKISGHVQPPEVTLMTRTLREIHRSSKNPAMWRCYSTIAWLGIRNDVFNPFVRFRLPPRPRLMTSVCSAPNE